MRHELGEMRIARGARLCLDGSVGGVGQARVVGEGEWSDVAEEEVG